MSKTKTFKSEIDFVNEAIKAFKVIDIVTDIINTSNIIIQEDVLKYKMICEVFKNEGYT